MKPELQKWWAGMSVKEKAALSVLAAIGAAIALFALGVGVGRGLAGFA